MTDGEGLQTSARAFAEGSTDSSRLPDAPARAGRGRVQPPRAFESPRRDQHPLTFEEVHAVANEVPDRYRALVYALAYGGLRWGEAAALRRRSCNLPRNRIEVREAVSEVKGGLGYRPTRTHPKQSRSHS